MKLWTGLANRRNQEIEKLDSKILKSTQYEQTPEDNIKKLKLDHKSFPNKITKTPNVDYQNKKEIRKTEGK